MSWPRPCSAYLLRAFRELLPILVLPAVHEGLRCRFKGDSRTIKGGRRGLLGSLVSSLIRKLVCINGLGNIDSSSRRGLRRKNWFGDR